MSNVIQIENVSKRFGKTIAMDNVSLSVPAGCVFAVWGENGAGKTTAIRSILGLQKPDQGKIEVLGRDPLKKGVELRREIGYVPDSPTLYPWMKVEEIGWFTSGFYAKGYQGSFEALCQQFELPLDRKIKQLSKGGKAKVGLALAMAHQPELLILDEPTSGLDTLVRRKFLECMVDVAAEGRTVLLSSHQIPEVERVADWVAIVNEGRVMVCERLDELKQQLERWVISFDGDEKQVPEFVGEILTHEGQGARRQQLVVRNPDANALWQLRDHPAIAEVEVHTPSLEEIFVAYMQADLSSQSSTQPSSPTKLDQEVNNG